MNVWYVPVQVLTEPPSLLISLAGPITSLVGSVTALVVSIFVSNRTYSVAKDTLLHSQAGFHRDLQLSKIKFIREIASKLASEALLQEQGQAVDHRGDGNVDRGLSDSMYSILLMLDPNDKYQTSIAKHVESYWSSESKVQWREAFIRMSRALIASMYEQINDPGFKHA